MSNTQKTERKYQLTRIEEGDYIVPSNDGQTLWRIRKYETDACWAAARFHLSVPELHARYGDGLPDDFLDWDNWQYHSGGFATRRAAIDDVLV